MNTALDFATHRYADISNAMRECKSRTNASIQDMLVVVEHSTAGDIPIYSPFSMITISDLRARRMPACLHFLRDENNYQRALTAVLERRASLVEGMIIVWAVNSSGMDLYRVETRAPDRTTFLYTDLVIENVQEQKELIVRFWPDHPCLTMLR